MQLKKSVRPAGRPAFLTMRKSLGQNFLNDKNILAKEARLLEAGGKTVLEIGPGDGRLTEQLLIAGAKKVIAVEKDPRMAEILNNRFAGKPVEIVNGDFLETNPAQFKIDRIAGNIPYYISSPIIFKLKEFSFEAAILMVQDEFARKMVTKPGEPGYGRLSVTSQLFYEVKYVQKVPASLFTPAPKVNSAMIMLKKTGVEVDENAENVIRALFSHKNKTVRNALLDSGYEKARIEVLGAPMLGMRPAKLALREILEICRKLE